MGALVNVPVYDGAATPVLHTLNPDGAESLKDGTLVVRYKENLSAVPDYAQVRASIKKRKLPSGVFRIEVETGVPVMESISGQNSAGYTAAPKVAYVNSLRSIGMFHERSTVTDRRLSRQLHTNFLNGNGASAAPNTGTNVTDSIDLLLLPN